MSLYNLDLLSKLVKQRKQIRDRSYAEKEGQQFLQTDLAEIYKPIIESHKKASDTNVSKLSEIVTKLDETKTESNTILNEINRRIATGNIKQMAVGNKLKKAIEDRPILIELIKTVTPNLGKVLLGEADVDILTKPEKKIFRIYDEIDDEDIKTLIDYYAFMKQPIGNVKGLEPEISDEPHPADIAAMVEPPTDISSMPTPPAYEVGGFQNEFEKGQNRHYDDLIKTIRGRKTDDAIGIEWNKHNNEFVLGDEKVYFNNNIIKIGEIEAKYTIGLETLLTKLTPDVSNQAITDADINTYLSMLKQGNVESEK